MSEFTSLLEIDILCDPIESILELFVAKCVVQISCQIIKLLDLDNCKIGLRNCCSCAYIGSATMGLVFC